MHVLKSSGEIEKFNSKKIYKSIRSAGGSKKLAHMAVKEVRKMHRDNLSSVEILKFLIKFLKREPGVSQRYDLKRAIMSLGPEGFIFEEFFARVLDHYGYKTIVGSKLKGKRIFQEVDIIATKEKKWMVECKYHNQPGIITRLHPALYTYARFLDLDKHSFDAPWLVTNTKCSTDAIEYAKGVNLKITGWRYPSNEGLQDLIMKKNLYPITILKSVPYEIFNRLYSARILVAIDLLEIPPEEISRRTGIDLKTVSKMIEEITEIVM